MYLKIALLLSVAMQIATAMIAIGLIKKTKFNISWILITLALLMMAVRLMYELPEVVDGVIVESAFGLAISWMGVLISLCMLVGIAFINKISRRSGKPIIYGTKWIKRCWKRSLKLKRAKEKDLPKNCTMV